MSHHNIILPSKPKATHEEGNFGVYEIDGLYPGYGHTLGNSLRRIILSSLPGSAMTSVKIDGAQHEFSTLDGIKEDVITILLHLKKVRFKVTGDSVGEIKVSINAKGPKIVTAKDIEVTGQVEVLNPGEYICEITDKSAKFNAEINIEKGLGFVERDQHQKGKVSVGTIALDAIFSPIRRVAYEVENMRVGDKTNHNRLRISIETDGTLTPREALVNAVEIMIYQLNSVIDFRVDLDKINEPAPKVEAKEEEADDKEEGNEDISDILKTRIDTLELSTRTLNALTDANIRTVGGIARKKKEDLLEIDGIGEKGIEEIKKTLSGFGLTLKQ